MRTSSTPHVVIRVDASPQIGLGHLMRMVALGQLLIDAQYHVHVVTVDYQTQHIDLLKAEGFNVHLIQAHEASDASIDVTHVIDLAQQCHAEWVIIDGYHFDHTYEQTLKQSGVKVLRIDDMARGHFYADIVLNQNYGADTFDYAKEPYTKILAGLNYVLLRREFRRIVPVEKVSNPVGPLHVMVSLGGVSQKTAQLNRQIIEALSRLSPNLLSATVLLGQTGSSLEVLKEVGASHVQLKAYSSSIIEDMLKADVAIVSGGSTMWELVYLRIPFMAISLNDQQQEYLKMLSTQGLCFNGGDYQHLTVDQLLHNIENFVSDRHQQQHMQHHYNALMDRQRIGLDILRMLKMV